MAKSILDSLFESVNGIEIKNSAKSQSSVYNKNLFKDFNILDESKALRRQLRKTLDNKFSEFVALAKTRNEKAINDFVAEFSAYYKKTYAVNNYEVSSLTKKVSEKSAAWKNVMATLLTLTKEYDSKQK